MPLLEFSDVTITLAAETCCKCGVAFAMPDTLQKARLDDRLSFYCPNGHAQYYLGKSVAGQLKDQLAAKERELLAAKSRVEHERALRIEAHQETDRVIRQRNAYKGVTTRLRNKVGKGVCPCCTAKFKDLKAHMRTEHPHWSPDTEAAALEAKRA